MKQTPAQKLSFQLKICLKIRINPQNFREILGSVHILSTVLDNIFRAKVFRSILNGKRLLYSGLF